MKTEIINISKSFGKKQILKDVCIESESGECVGILGTNGSGKSTLFSILTGILKSDGGDFLCDGESLFKNTKKRSELVGFVPQSTPLIEELTALDNLRLWYTKENMNYELENGVLGILGIDAFLKTKVSKMSGGMKKRLAIGCAAAGSPGLLLLDEPSAALDLICKERIANYLREYKAEGGAILLATHDMHEMELCDKWFIIKDGKLMPYQYDGDIKRLVGLL